MNAPSRTSSVAALFRAFSLFAVTWGCGWALAEDAATPVPGRPAKNVPYQPGAEKIVDYTDPTYGGRIRQLQKEDGHEHNFYYYRDPWNADGSYLLGIQSDLQQKN